MAAQAAYIARGMTGPSPDMDMDLLPIPAALKADLRSGFTLGRSPQWTKDQLMTLTYEEMLEIQAKLL